MTRALIQQMLDALEVTLAITMSAIDQRNAAITAAREYLAAPEQSEPVATYWMIECRNGFVGWFVGEGRVDCRFFNTDPHKGKRFASKEEAEAVMCNSCQIATEHVDVGLPRPQPTELTDADLTIAYMAGYHKGKKAERDAYQVAADDLAAECKVLRDGQKVCTSAGCVKESSNFIHDPALIRAAWESDTDFEGAPV